MIGIGDIGASSNPTPAGPRNFGPNTLLLGYIFGWLPQDASLPTFTSAPYAMWLPRQNQGGGSVLVAEQSAGIDDQAQFLREHLAPLQNTAPTPLMSRPADVSDVRLYRVGGEFLRSGMHILGTPTGP